MNPSYLSEQEKAAVQAFCENPVAFSAVKKVLLATIFHQGVLTPGSVNTEMNWAFQLTSVAEGQKTDEQLGQELRASNKALSFLEQGFQRLQEFKAPAQLPQKKNRAL